MSIWRRYKGKKVSHGSKDYKRATWIIDVRRNGQKYTKAHPEITTREDALIKEAEITALIFSGEIDFHRDKTGFRDYVENVYLPFVKLNNISWTGNKQYQLERLKNYFKDKLLKSITRAMCEDYKRERAANLTPTGTIVKSSTVNRDLITMKHVFQLALQDGKIKANPAQFVSLLREPEARTRILTSDERTRLFAALQSNQQLLAIVTVALTTGWRKGQILAVDKEHLDYERQAVLVQKSKQQKARLMPVSNVAWSILTRYAEMTNSGAIFRSPRTDKRLVHIKAGWYKALDKAGIEGFHFHDLRASAVSALLDKGVSAFDMKNILGHASVQTTGIYARSSNEDLRDSLNKMSDLLM